MCLASSPILKAVNRHATMAMSTDSGKAPPAKATPVGIEAATAAAGAMSVMLWNSTSRRPIALLRSPVSVLVAAAVIARPPLRALNPTGLDATPVHQVPVDSTREAGRTPRCQPTARGSRLPNSQTGRYRAFQDLHPDIRVRRGGRLW